MLAIENASREALKRSKTLNLAIFLHNFFEEWASTQKQASNNDNNDDDL